MASPLPISVVIIAKNEAQTLPRCLASVTGWTSEIVVALNNTTDGSDTIARNLGASVHNLPWQGYRDTKNAALALAKQTWVLSLDADEEVSPRLRESLAAFFARADHDAFAGARFPRKVWFIDRWITHGDWYPDLSLRLLHVGRALWGGDAFVHEKVECDGPVATLTGDLNHYSFPTLASHVSKINPFADLFVRQQQPKAENFRARRDLPPVLALLPRVFAQARFPRRLSWFLHRVGHGLQRLCPLQPALRSRKSPRSPEVMATKRHKIFRDCEIPLHRAYRRAEEIAEGNQLLLCLFVANRLVRLVPHA